MFGFNWDLSLMGGALTLGGAIALNSTTAQGRAVGIAISVLGFFGTFAFAVFIENRCGRGLAGVVSEVIDFGRGCEGRVTSWSLLWVAMLMIGAPVAWLLSMNLLSQGALFSDPVARLNAQIEAKNAQIEAKKAAIAEAERLKEEHRRKEAERRKREQQAQELAALKAQEEALKRELQTQERAEKRWAWRARLWRRSLLWLRMGAAVAALATVIATMIHISAVVARTPFRCVTVAAAVGVRFNGDCVALKETYIRASNTDISNLAPLTGLQGLQSLYLSSTEVSDLAPLAGLQGLQSLDLHSTEVSDLTPLAGLQGLQSLYLSSTEVGDLTPLAGMMQLHWLVTPDGAMHGSPVSDSEAARAEVAAQIQAWRPISR